MSEFHEIRVNGELWYSWDEKTQLLHIHAGGEPPPARPYTMQLWDSLCESTRDIFKDYEVVVKKPDVPPYDDDGRCIAYVPEDELRRCQPSAAIGWTVWGDMLFEAGEFRGVVERIEMLNVDGTFFVAVHVENPLECRDDDEQ